MKTAPSPLKNYLHYDLERVDYSLTQQELEALRSASQNNWKDFGIGCLAVGIPCLLNAICLVHSTSPFTVTLPFTINGIAAGLGLVLGVAFLFAWQKTKRSVDRIIEQIRKKPRIEIPPQFTDIGAMEDDKGQSLPGSNA